MNRIDVIRKDVRLARKLQDVANQAHLVPPLTLRVDTAEFMIAEIDRLRDVLRHIYISSTDGASVELLREIALDALQSEKECGGN